MALLLMAFLCYLEDCPGLALIALVLAIITEHPP